MLRPLSESEIILARNCHTHNQPLYWRVRPPVWGRNVAKRRNKQTTMATATLTRTDEQVQTDVLAELKWNAHGQPNEIGVAVKNGVVTLTGWVDSYLKKWSAEEAAHRLKGVKAVANDIEGPLPNSYARPDADI